MLPTLKGVFPQPKVQHRRDFLRENKLHLKDIQRNSHRQHIQAEEQKKLEEQRRRQRHKSLDLRPILSHARPVCCCSCECQARSQNTTSCRTESSEKCVQMTRVETCNREVQTDDICDEDFLYDALKRCSSIDSEKELYTNNANAHPEEKKQTIDRLPSNLSENQFNPNDHNLNFENLTIDTERLPTTATSTQINTKRMSRRLHELGDRYDIRLPKYLEREKREKELQRQRELARDRNCPEGYVALSENDRKSALEKAERKFKSLINELNRMPMTTETLRLRGRKVEIERELVEIENDIRIFSKSKVYVKSNAI